MQFDFQRDKQYYFRDSLTKKNIYILITRLFLFQICNTFFSGEHKEDISGKG